MWLKHALLEHSKQQAHLQICCNCGAMLQVDTVFLCFVLVYITQLLLFTWTLEDQLSLRWPLFGYVVVPLLVLQHGDPSWYVALPSHLQTVLMSQA